MEQQPRGRGRARGRARGPPTAAEPGQAAAPGQPRSGPRPPQTGAWGAPAQGAWGAQAAAQRQQQQAPAQRPPSQAPAQRPQPQAPAPTPTAWGPRPQFTQQHQIRAPVPQVQELQAGRAVYRGGGDRKAPGDEQDVAGSVVGAGGDAGSHSGRGSMRGRRPIGELYYKTRPAEVQSKQGYTGTKIMLQANYFKLKKQTSWCLYQSRVDFSPTEDQTVVRKKLLRTAMREILPVYVFDGTVLYASQRLDPNPFEIFVDHPTQEGVRVRITIKRVGDLADGDYHFLQFFNIIMRKCMGFLRLQLVGRNFFDAAARVVIPTYRMELWPGYVTSIRQHEESILMCCEISTKFMRNDTVLHVLNECMQEDRSNYKRNFQNKVIGTIVLTDYNNRTYRVDDIDWTTTTQSTFERQDGTSVAYEDYYKEKYNLNIADKRQPMLISRAKPREIRAGMRELIFLVPELCRLTGLTAAQRTNFQLMRALAEHTRVGPRQRIEKLMRFSNRLRSNPQIVEELRAWDMELADELVQLPARQYNVERIFGGSGTEYHGGDFANWTTHVRQKPMISLSKFNRWAVICPQRSRQQVENFTRMIKRCASGMSWMIGEPRIFEIKDDRPGPYLEAIDMVIAQGLPQLIMCCVSNNKADRYSAIKKKLCVDKPIPSQVVLTNRMEGKEAMSIATKVAIQMNCKLGGAPWSVSVPFQNAMIAGFDVCHDPHDKSKSYGALVASLDKSLSRYSNNVSSHVNGEEISKHFALNMVKACKTYQSHNGQLPDKIIVYRDGVGDGQIPYIKEQEVEHMKKVLKETLYGDNLKLCFVIVSKRINTRFFLNGNNPNPGTIIDSTVTLPERYDFFIVSQCVRQGTVAPTSYNVIEDNIGLSVDNMHRLTYKLTHMYFNWSGTVRVPAPCQYAHKLAFLVSQNLHRTPHPGLDTLLYFL